jgi:hypothetical protein
MEIAKRTLTLRGRSGTIDIPIRIYAPGCEKPGVWRCRYEIGWPEGHHSLAGYGVDSMQAIIITLGMIGAEIYSSSYHKSGDLWWDAPGNGYGFPVVPALRDLLQGDDAKYL